MRLTDAVGEILSLVELKLIIFQILAQSLQHSTQIPPVLLPIGVKIIHLWLTLLRYQATHN